MTPMDRKEYLLKYQKEWIRKRRLDWLAENGPCKNCGSNEKLEVDHIDPKTKKTHAVWSWTKEKRDEELKKCQVLCRKCHKEKTKKDISQMFSGIPKLSKRTVTNETLEKVVGFIKSGLSERKACALVGVSRGTFSALKCRAYRPEVFGYKK